MFQGITGLLDTRVLPTTHLRICFAECTENIYIYISLSIYLSIYLLI